jgi:hypothetical protein
MTNAQRKRFQERQSRIAPTVEYVDETKRPKPRPHPKPFNQRQVKKKEPSPIVELIGVVTALLIALLVLYL